MTRDRSFRAPAFASVVLTFIKKVYTQTCTHIRCTCLVKKTLHCGASPITPAKRFNLNFDSKFVIINALLEISYRIDTPTSPPPFRE